MPSSLSRRDLIRRLAAFGFEGPFSGGKHQFMRKGKLKLRVPNPHGGDCSDGRMRRIIRQTEISEADWDNWTKVTGKK